MKRKGYFSKHIATKQNFEDAFYAYANQKHSRKYIKDFEKDLEGNLLSLLRAYDSGTWRTSPYKYKDITNPKPRKISKLEAKDHVIQWAASLQYEPYLLSSLYWKSCSCVPGKGTHYFVKIEKNELYYSPQKETYYFVQLDIHHYFLHIAHPLMKQILLRKIKDRKLLNFIFEIIDSFVQGLPLGIKMSQLNANMYLSSFDWKAIKCFGLTGDLDKLQYWRSRYVTDKFLSCRSSEQANELSKGVQFLNNQFDGYVRQGLKHYARFADNIIIMHQDKTFLHLITELAVMSLARDYYLTVNKNWNIRPVYAGGIDVCGYVFFHDHLRLRKRNKQALCRQVAKLKKKGYSKRDIRLKCASRVGFAIHADTRNLLKKLDIDMEKRLGKVINNRRKKAPFEGMAVEQKKSIEEIVCKESDSESSKLILLVDYKIDDSVIEKNEDGSPKQRIVIRYKVIDRIENQDAEEPVYVWGKEYYSFSGSKIMIDQAEQDFSKEDLPVVTAIREFINKQRKKFYKFT